VSASSQVGRTSPVAGSMSAAIADFHYRSYRYA
jgi:hypothetical protein